MTRPALTDPLAPHEWNEIRQRLGLTWPEFAARLGIKERRLRSLRAGYDQRGEARADEPVQILARLLDYTAQMDRLLTEGIHLEPVGRPVERRWSYVDGSDAAEAAAIYRVRYRPAGEGEYTVSENTAEGTRAIGVAYTLPGARRLIEGYQLEALRRAMQGHTT